MGSVLRPAAVVRTGFAVQAALAALLVGTWVVDPYVFAVAVLAQATFAAAHLVWTAAALLRGQSPRGDRVAGLAVVALILITTALSTWRLATVGWA